MNIINNTHQTFLRNEAIHTRHFATHEMSLRDKGRCLFGILLMLLVAMTLGQHAQGQTEAVKKGIATPELYNEIFRADSALFAAYNAHNVEKMKPFFSEDMEFYHDLGGLSNYAQNVAAFTNIFTQNTDIRRDLVPGTLEVYPIKNYGAIEIGAHRFCHTENGQMICGTFKFTMVWQQKDGQWKLTRIISYGH
jgi:hypothetical protein